MPDPVGDRLARELARLAGRVDGSPPPLEVLERRSATPPPQRSARWPAALAMAAAVVGVAAAVGAALLALPGGGPGDTVASQAAAPGASPGPAPSPAGPSPAAASTQTPTPAFAVASGGTILGLGGTLLSSTEPAGEPHWSDDGRWLAFQDASADSIHVVGADGSAENVAWKGRVHAFVWSAAGPDLLAVAPADGGLALVTPEGRVRWVLRPGTAVESAAWRGADLTWTTEQPRASMGVLPAGGTPVTLGPWPAPGADLILSSWVGADHLLAWEGGDGRDEAEGLPLEDISVDGSRLSAGVPLATTLVATTWVVPGPGGTPTARQVLIVAGGGSVPWQRKGVDRCDLVTDRCVPLVDAGSGAVTLDPAWSPDGTRVAFVEAPAWSPPRAGTVATWYPTRRLWVVDADGSHAMAVAGASPGAAAPAWTAGGGAITYSTGSTVERVSPTGDGAVVVLGSLTGGGNGAGPDGYGKGPWHSVAVWAPTG